MNLCRVTCKSRPVETQKIARKMRRRAEDDRTDYCGNAVSDSTQSKPQQMVEDSLCALVSRIESMKLSAESGVNRLVSVSRVFCVVGDILHDVNTYLAIAEALKIYGHTVPATYLSCAISFALLKFLPRMYSRNI